ncbi:MAG: cytochrome P450 [Spirirestis rafaelensis WJT71-NPBG6]|jgi:cytochrome P450|nr:cytochrome P450 [Spirirestis rafaelensis WJT71-NPBG6]
MTSTRTEKSLPLPPGSFGLPFIGETISFLRDRDFAQKRHERYGAIFKTHLFGRPTVMMLGAEANRFLFTNENQYFSVTWPYSTKVLLGPASLAMQTGEIHQKRRKLLSQVFQPRALAGYISTMESIIQSYLQKWQQMGTLTWYPELRKYTFDVACKLFIGTDATADSHFGELFEEYCQGLFSIPVRLPWTQFGRALRAREQLLAKIEEVVRQRQHQPSILDDALGLLLQARDEDGNSLSLEELKDQVLTLLFAGHETLTSAIASLCLLLAQHPDILATARAEQQQLGFHEPLTLEHLKQMNYLELVIKEALRLIPPVGGGFREVIKECGVNNFDPLRFAQERAEDKTKAFSYIPFGGGMRECVGKEFAKLEMKLFAALLIRQYEWELVPEQNLDMIMVPTPHPRDGLQVKFRNAVSNSQAKLGN